MPPAKLSITLSVYKTISIAESDLFLQKMTNRTKITQKSSKKHSIDTISKLQFCSKEYIESTLSTIFPSLKTVLEEFW